MGKFITVFTFGDRCSNTFEKARFDKVFSAAAMWLPLLENCGLLLP